MLDCSINAMISGKHKLVPTVNQTIHATRYSSYKYFACRQYTGCPSRNVPDFWRMFLMLKYTNITQNTCIQSWRVTKIMAKEKCCLLAVPRTVPVSRDVIPVHCACLSLRVECSHVANTLWTVSYLYGVAKMPFDVCWKLHSNWRRTLWTITVKQVLYFSTVM